MKRKILALAAMGVAITLFIVGCSNKNSPVQSGDNLQQNSNVSKDVPKNTVVGSVPTKIIKIKKNGIYDQVV